MKQTLVPKSSEIFQCDQCDYFTSRHSQYQRHLTTLKHKMKQNETVSAQKNPLHNCTKCNQIFNSRTTLWRHAKKCNSNQSEPTSATQSIDTNLVVELIKQNRELQQHLIAANTINNNNTTNNNNTQNNHFNINVFLHETCKDAMNFSDFIERIEVSHDDLENNAQLGFVNGMTKILMDNLKMLTLQERPIHCTDVKRDTLYIKDKDVWNKDQSVEILENAIKEVSRKSMQSLIQWKKTNPDYSDMDSEFSKKCIPMQQNSMGLCNKSAFYPKIIHNLAKENTIAQLKV